LLMKFIETYIIFFLTIFILIYNIILINCHISVKSVLIAQFRNTVALHLNNIDLKVDDLTFICLILPGREFAPEA
jgi:hypothetical protein